MGLEIRLTHKHGGLMPKDFTDCVKSGGRVVTKNLKNNKYIHICYDKNGNSHSGEVKTKQKRKKKGENKTKIEKSKALLKSLKELQEYYNKHYHTD